MTRKIMLTLADDTTDTECGHCNGMTYHGSFRGSHVATCEPFRADLVHRGRFQRAPECRAAEAAAARCVEIEPEDAQLVTIEVGGDIGAMERVEAALREHGKRGVR